MSIYIKNNQEIEKMRQAGKLAAQVLDMIAPFVQVGVSTEELDKICHDYIVDVLHAIPAPLNYGNPPFPKSICTSINHVICHGIPGNRKLANGDIVNIDITVIKDGFHGDTSKMFILGKTKKRAEILCKVTRDAMLAGIKTVRAGIHLGDIGFAIAQVAHKYRFSVVREFCGHGIGKNFHEPPQILHYGNRGEGIKIEPGMTFTIEPMINIGKRNIRQLADQWTIVTKDKSWSAQWEHTILVTDSGYEVLTAREEETDLYD